MTKYLTFARLVIIAVAVIVLGALLGWYYFLQGKTAQTNQQSVAAGYGVAAPTFQGSTGSTYANAVSTLGVATGSVAVSTSSRLWEVSAVPVAGFGWQKGVTPALDFVERSSGYVFNAQTQDRSVTRLTDTLRPKTYEASITLDGSLFERSIDDTGNIITFAGSIASSSPNNAASSTMGLIGNTLVTGIRAIAADPVSDTLFYMVPGPSGVSLVSSGFSGTKQRQIFSSAIGGWRLFGPGDGTLVMLQDPLDGSLGYAYQLQKNGSLSLIAQAEGLTVLPHVASSALIFGSSLNGQLSLFAQATANSVPQRLSLKTVADKCAWGTGPNLIAYCGVPETIATSNFLNDWYKGLTHTTDTFYEIDASAASSSLLYDPTGDTSAQLDVEDAAVDPTGRYLAFINARDRSLWIMRIAQ